MPAAEEPVPRRARNKLPRQGGTEIVEMCALTAILHTTREEADSISRRAAVLRRLAELEGKASRLRDEIRAYEEKYGLDSRELVRLWDEALERGEALDLDIPDLDLVEWRSLWELYQEILEEVEKLRAELGSQRRPGPEGSRQQRGRG